MKQFYLLLLTFLLAAAGLCTDADIGRPGKSPSEASVKYETGNWKSDTSEATDGTKRAFGAYSGPCSDFRLRTSNFTLGSSNVQTDTGPARGYIVTKNGKQLTGYIGDIYHSDLRSVVVFINDFGSVYSIEAERIRGFVFSNEKGYTAYESKNCRHRWYYLRILEKGAALNLYQSPEEEYSIRFENGVLQANTRSITEFWVEAEGRKYPIRIDRLNFRRKMRRLFQKMDAPKFREKIGQENYRFKNLPEIIREYNQDRSLNKREI